MMIRWPGRERWPKWPIIIIGIRWPNDLVPCLMYIGLLLLYLGQHINAKLYSYTCTIQNNDDIQLVFMPLIGQSAAIGLLANLRWCSEYQQLPNADINTNRNPTFITCAKNRIIANPQSADSVQQGTWNLGLRVILCDFCAVSHREADALI